MNPTTKAGESAPAIGLAARSIETRQIGNVLIQHVHILTITSTSGWKNWCGTKARAAMIGNCFVSNRPTLRMCLFLSVCFGTLCSIAFPSSAHAENPAKAEKIQELISRIDAGLDKINYEQAWEAAILGIAIEPSSVELARKIMDLPEPKNKDEFRTRIIAGVVLLAAGEKSRLNLEQTLSDDLARYGSTNGERIIELQNSISREIPLSSFADDTRMTVFGEIVSSLQVRGNLHEYLPQLREVLVLQTAIFSSRIEIQYLNAIKKSERGKLYISVILYSILTEPNSCSLIPSDLREDYYRLGLEAIDVSADVLPTKLFWRAHLLEGIDKTGCSEIQHLIDDPSTEDVLLGLRTLAEDGAAQNLPAFAFARMQYPFSEETKPQITELERRLVKSIEEELLTKASEWKRGNYPIDQWESILTKIHGCTTNIEAQDMESIATIMEIAGFVGPELEEVDEFKRAELTLRKITFSESQFSWSPENGWTAHNPEATTLSSLLSKKRNDSDLSGRWALHYLNLDAALQEKIKAAVLPLEQARLKQGIEQQQRQAAQARIKQLGLDDPEKVLAAYLKNDSAIVEANLLGWERDIAHIRAIFNGRYITKGGFERRAAFSIYMEYNKPTGIWAVYTFEPKGISRVFPLRTSWRDAFNDLKSNRTTWNPNVPVGF